MRRRSSKSTWAWLTALGGIPLRRVLIRVTGITIGTIIVVIGYALFQLPFNLAAGGVGGAAIVVNSFTGWPVGLMVLLANIPLLILGFYQLGRWRFLFYTALSVLIFSFGIDLMRSFFPDVTARDGALTDDMLLSSIYAGIIVGIGNGMVFRFGGTMGGTNVIGRIIQQYTGIPLSQVYLYSDGLVVLLAGLAFGWELALHAMLTLFLAGIASDFAIEGPSVVRTATIVTQHPHELTQALRDGLRRGASYWQVTGSYSGEQRSMVMCTVSRSQVEDLKYIMPKSIRRPSW
ncbi:MAG: YitT family protein [Chloroflexaceae bacterium]|nr:YitT family protein [Chloroflexaceae bacterium]